MEFVIPTCRDGLLSRSQLSHYCVEEVLTLRQIPTALQAFKSSSRGNAQCIVDHFDTLFSILCVQKDLDAAVKQEAWQSLLRGCQTFNCSLANFLDGSDLNREERVSNLNAVKMSCYLLCQFMEIFDAEATRPYAVATAKGRGRKPKPSVNSLSMDWEFERQQGLQALLSFIQLSLNKLWDPPLADEEFVSLVSTCCYKLLENPTIIKVKESVVTMAHILGNLIKRYNHGLGASLKIDQLLKHFEFLTMTLAEIVEIMVSEHGCKATVTELIREIGNTDTREAARDTVVAKAYSAFLVELADKMPSVILPCTPLIVCHLDGESYTLRNGVLGMMGQILVNYLCKEELDGKLKATRDGFFEKLEDHIHDVNAFVRSKVLQIWMTIVSEQCLPLLRQESLMALVVGRLNDKSSIVRRHALLLVTALLKTNPFAAKLPVEDLRANYEKEKAQLEEMMPEAVTTKVPITPENEEINQEWAMLKNKLVECWAGSNSSGDDDATALISDNESSDDVLSRIVTCLDKLEFMQARNLTAAAMEAYPDLAVFSVGNTRGVKPADEDMEICEEDAVEKDKLLLTIKEVYYWVKHLTVPHASDVSGASMVGDDLEVAKQKTLVQYLQNSLTFAIQVQQCIPVISQLLGSKNTTDVLEAIQFFVTAFEFGVSTAIVGIRRMMVLIWSQEASIREATVAAYRTLYLEPKEKNQRSAAFTTVQNLSSLIFSSTFGDLASLEALVSEFVKSGDIGPQVIQALWEVFTRKSPTVTAQDCRAAVHLISMCASAQPEIVKSNIEVLVEEGFGVRAETDFLLAQGACQVLLKLCDAPKEKGKAAAPPFRLPSDHEVFARLKIILVKGLTDKLNNYWIPLADLAVMLIYRLAEGPDALCADMLRESVAILREMCPEAVNPQGDGVEDSNPVNDLSCVLTRTLAMAGQVAFRQAILMEVDILGEMKRRQAIMEDSRRKDVGKSQSRLSKASRNESELDEDTALAGASAEDTEAEFIRRICELEIIHQNNFLASFHPLLVLVCSNSAKFPDVALQTAASLALARFMIVSGQFCESQLQLLFTILEKSPFPDIRSNLIIALGDLTFRFPNLVEPWTSHLYARLRDDSPLVRKTTLQVLTHLILNDMVKVKGQISELATCIVDPNERIAGLAKLFFHELAKKGNSMYNMPDIISRLSDPDIGVEEDSFQTIIKFIFSHIEKSKHCESLAEKLCHRFRATRTERQARDLSFCLSQLSFTEKGLGKLLENFPCFADKLVDPEIYEHFCHIISKCRHFVLPEAKTCLEEFETKLEQAHTKGLEDGDVVTKATKSVCVKTKGKAAKAKAPVGRRKKANKENYDNEEEEVEVDPVSPYKPRRGLRGREKTTKPRFSLDSDDNDDDALFDMGKEGEKEYDLNTSDSFITRPSARRSQRGKVQLTSPSM